MPCGPLEAEARAASQGTNNSRLPHMRMLHATLDHGPQVFDPGRPGGFPVLPAMAKRSDSSQKWQPPAQAGKHPASTRYFSGVFQLPRPCGTILKPLSAPMFRRSESVLPDCLQHVHSNM